MSTSLIPVGLPYYVLEDGERTRATAHKRLSRAAAADYFDADKTWPVGARARWVDAETSEVFEYDGADWTPVDAPAPAEVVAAAKAPKKAAKSPGTRAPKAPDGTLYVFRAPAKPLRGNRAVNMDGLAELGATFTRDAAIALWEPAWDAKEARAIWADARYVGLIVPAPTVAPGTDSAPSPEVAAPKTPKAKTVEHLASEAVAAAAPDGFNAQAPKTAAPAKGRRAKKAKAVAA